MQEQLKKIKVLAMDVDGVLTDGRIIVNDRGEETKFFDVQDGLGIVLAGRCGLKTALISARNSKAAQFRAKDLKIDKTYLGVYPKIAGYEQMLKDFGFKDEEICFVGDDVADITIMKRCGVAVAVANAVAEVKKAAHHVTGLTGGHGAVREAIEWVLKAQGHWRPQLYEF
jgi:3-deoxy-D-manno-octulosonate 8-phosphate phosphatase (KDO 8-P phosphatase)